MMTRRTIFKSDDQTWNTPRWFVDLIEGAFGRVMFDPCSNATSVVNAVVEVRYFESGVDGASLEWAGRGLTYVNPPFGRELPVWLPKCATADECVALVPSRTDTAWWQDAHVLADAALAWRGRFKFNLRGKGKGNAPFPSTVFYWGARVTTFRETFRARGRFVK